MRESIADQLSKIFNRTLPVSKPKKKPREHPITENSFKIGSILKMTLDKSDGIIPKDGYKTRRKYFVVLGEIKEDRIVGSFFINSDINANVQTTRELQDCQILLEEANYPAILDYDSYLDCSDIFELDKTKIEAIGSQIGQLLETDISRVTEHIEKTGVISPKQKKKFGFKDKS